MKLAKSDLLLHKSGIALAVPYKIEFVVSNRQANFLRLVPIDFHLFPKMKTELCGNKFISNDLV